MEGIRVTAIYVPTLIGFELLNASPGVTVTNRTTDVGGITYLRLGA